MSAAHIIDYRILESGSAAIRTAVIFFYISNEGISILENTGRIDMIITKSISRFARNILDILNYVRTLKELGIGVIFEKQNIDTLDSKGGGSSYNIKFFSTR